MECLLNLIKLFGIIISIPTILIAVLSYKKNVKLNNLKFIDSIYNKFLSNDIDELTYKITNNKIKILTEDSYDGMTLNKILTLFDSIFNYYHEGIINKNLLSLISYEILIFSSSKIVLDYINNFNKKYNKLLSKTNIKPYSGIIELEKIIKIN